MREGVGKATPLLDYRTSVAAWPLFELSPRGPSGLIVSFPRPPRPRLRPRPNLFIYALLRRQPANDHRSKTLQIGFGLISLPSPSLDSIRFANLDPPLPGVNDLDLQKKKKKLNRVDSFLVNERIFLSKLIEMDWRWEESLIINDWIGNGGGFGHSRVENRLVRVSSDEAGNDGAAAHCCSYCSFRIHPNWISEKSHSRLPARANRRLLIINSNRFSFFHPPSILLCILFAQFISYEAKKKRTKHILLSSIFMILSHDRKIQTIFLMIPRNPG